MVETISAPVAKVLLEDPTALGVQASMHAKLELPLTRSGVRPVACLPAATLQPGKGLVRGARGRVLIMTVGSF